MPTLRPRVITLLDVEASEADARRAPEVNIEAQGAHAPGPAPLVEDPYVNKLIKYIPAEIIALQQLLNGLSELTSTAVFLAGWLSIGLLALTPFWFAASTKETGEPIAWSQVFLSTIAFAIWLFAVSSPAIPLFRSWGLPETGLGPGDWSIVFAFFVTVTPMLEKVFVQLGSD